MKPWLERTKNSEPSGTLLVELRLEEQYNYKVLLRMTSENFEEIIQLIKDDIPKEKYNFSHTWLFINSELYKNYGHEYYSS